MTPAAPRSTPPSPSPPSPASPPAGEVLSECGRGRTTQLAWLLGERANERKNERFRRQRFIRQAPRPKPNQRFEQLCQQSTLQAHLVFEVQRLVSRVGHRVVGIAVVHRVLLKDDGARLVVDLLGLVRLVLVLCDARVRHVHAGVVHLAVSTRGEWSCVP